ncbi:MAG: TIGR02391 family protein [Rhodocyclaceae bacterium]
MQPSDLAGYVLECLMSAGRMEQGVWNRRNFCMQVGREYADSGQPPDLAVGIACSSAWAWLEANSFICRNPDQDNEWYVPTSRGEALRNHQDLRTFLTSAQLPEAFLHPELLVNVRPLFFQSRFETAVFEAFKTLEVAIRTTAELGHDLVGVQLASRAFNPEDGPLTDQAVEKGERVALMNLMTGALGSYKNPASHRRVEITAEEARDMIVLASHLLKIVNSRRGV